jgi:HlyD family secretion protein
MTRPVTWISRIAAALVILGGVAWILRPRAVVVDTALVTRGRLEATVTAEGKTRVKDLFTLAAPVEGELERITLKAGDTVRPTMVVAQLWPVTPRPLDVRSRAEAVAAVTSARATVERAEATQKEAVGALTHAESTFATTKKLVNERVVAPNDLEHAGHEVEIRRQALQASRAALDVARAELARAEAAAANSTGQTGRALTPVRTPIAGRVLRVLHESAGPVTAGTPLLEIGDLANLEIVADYLTTDAMAVQPGAPATIQDWGDGPPLAARVRRIEPAAFTKVSPLGLEEQRVSVVLDLVEPRPLSFGHDYHVKVAIVVWTGEDVLTVPSTALFRVGEDWAVFGVRGNRVEVTRVVVGRADGTRSVIERGLTAGDSVVVQPSDALQDRSRVAVLARATR